MGAKIKVSMYWLVFAALIALTILTVAASRLPLPEPWHTGIALLIAVAKATLVILIFMHVWLSSRLTWVIVLSSILWLAILIGLTFNDYLTRSWDRWQPQEQVRP